MEKRLYVCMYCMYICTVCMYVHMYEKMYEGNSKHLYVLYVCMYVCMYEGMNINKLQLMAVCMSGFDIIVFSSISVYVCVRAYA